MPDTLRVLYVDDETSYHHMFRHGLDKERIRLETSASGREALHLLQSFPADLVFTDLRMPHMSGLELLREIRSLYPGIFVVLITGQGEVEDAVKAMKAGAYDFLEKPVDFAVIMPLIRKITDHKKLLLKGEGAGNERRTKFRFENIVGQNAQLYKIFQTIADVADSRATVLIHGESGTGKELIAEAIHYGSSRRAKPLVTVNCTAFTETLINSELFGHERGAFTGAMAQKKGLFEAADQGTIFLDEIGDISVSTQLSLLRVLDSGSFQRVGGTKAIHVDARVVCATNRDLAKAVQDGLFREDLYYRINVVTVHVPALRERRSDVPLLAYHFLKKKCQDAGKAVPRISTLAMEIMARYDWPGNIRELANVMENLAIFGKKPEIRPEDLPEKLLQARKDEGFSLGLSDRSLPRAEEILIRTVLEETGWNLKKAAELLEIARGTLYSKMEKYGIQKEEYGAQARPEK